MAILIKIPLSTFLETAMILASLYMYPPIHLHDTDTGGLRLASVAFLLFSGVAGFIFFPDSGIPRVRSKSFSMHDRIIAMEATNHAKRSHDKTMGDVSEEISSEKRMALAA